MEINQAKLTGYRRLVDSGRRTIDEVPEPYKQRILCEINREI